MSYFYNTPADGTFRERDKVEKIRCQACGAAYWRGAKYLRRLWVGGGAVLRLKCGECGARHDFAPGTIFTEH